MTFVLMDDRGHVLPMWPDVQAQNEDYKFYKAIEEERTQSGE